MRTETVVTFELVKLKQKLLDIRAEKEKKRNAREVGKLIDENSACVEVGTTHKHLRRGDKSNNFKNYFSSNDITCEEVKSVDSQRFLHWIHRTCEQQGSQKKKKKARHTSICCKIDGKLQYYCSLRKVNSFESLCDLIISDKLFETLNKETATHIGIREAEDWFRPIDLAKECDIYISSRSGSRKEILLLMDIPKTPLKIDHKTLNQRLKENYPQYLERENKNCYICGDSSHYAETPGSGSEGKEIVLNRRPELYRGKYRCVQPKINLLKKTFFCLFSSGLHGSTAADSVRSEWPLWHAAKKQNTVFARRRS
ncbi:DUF1758 domain-containing protein [Trichonephila clavipes]|nr:DUF1758 domain-containing protein [Trichonephila clavipes]